MIVLNFVHCGANLLQKRTEWIRIYHKLSAVWYEFIEVTIILRAVASHRCWSHVATCLYMYIFV